MQVSAKRKTAESEVTVKIDFGPRWSDYKKGLQTTMPFLNHMLEHIVCRGEFNMEVKVQLQEFYLSHVVCEDIGITMGRALKEYIQSRLGDGLVGYGFALAAIDEALARAVVSFENRANFHFSHSGVVIPERTEEISSEDLKTFLEGFVQGASCTLHLDVLKGENGHHIWEAVYRAFGGSLFNALEVRKWREGLTAGVAGPVHTETDL